MSGRTDLLIYPVVLLSAVAAVTDLARGRIYNWLTLPGVLLGLAASAGFGGWTGLGDGLLGMLAGFLLYGWMFWFGAMGGGDVKLLMALGAWGGFQFAVKTGLLGIVLGGAMALAILVVTGRITGFVSRMYRFLLTLFVKELEMEVPQVDRKLTMPYGVPIAAAAVWIALADPFEKWGIRLWG